MLNINLMVSTDNFLPYKTFAVNSSIKTLICMSFLITFIFCRIAYPTWTTSNYIQAANGNVINTLTGNGQPTTYTFVHKTAFSTLPNLGYGIKNYKANDYFGDERFQFQKTAQNPSSFSITAVIQGWTNLWVLNIAYIAIDPSFPHHLNSFENVPINSTSGPLVNISSKSLSVETFTQLFDYSVQAAGKTHSQFATPLSNNKILLFMSSLFIYGTFGTQNVVYYPVKLGISTNIINTTHYTMTATAQINIKIQRLHFSEIIFDIEDVKTSGKYQLIYQVWQTDSMGGFFSLPVQFVDNFLMCLTSFQTIDANCSFYYKWEFQTVNNVFGVQLFQSLNDKAVGRIPICSFNKMISTIFYMKTWICDNNHPYFSTAQNLCCDQLFNNVCLQYCGDGVALNGQECDDGNQQSGDGCSSTCTVQQYWTCSSVGCCVIQPNVFSLSLISYSKVLDQNKLKIYFSIQPKVEYFTKHMQNILDNTVVLATKVQGKAEAMSYEQSTQRIMLQLSYGEGIQIPFQITFIFEIPFAHDNCSAGTSQVILTIDGDPDNNLPPVYYSDDEYKTRKALSTMNTTIASFTWFILFWSLFIGKIIGLQLIGVLQLAFINLANHDSVNLMLTGLLDIQFVNGLNIDLFSLFNIQSDQSLPSRITLLQYHESFLQNCNIMAFFLILATLFGCILYTILNKTSFIPQKYSNLLKSIIKQGILTIAMFNCLNFSFSAGINWRYNKLEMNWEVINQLIIVFLLLISLGIIFLLLLSSNDEFGQFTKKFKRQKFSQAYIPLTLLYRFLLGLFIAYNNEHQLSTLLILSFVILFLIYYFVHLPFNKAYHNYRSSLCHLTFATILFVTMYYRSMKSSALLRIKAQIFIPAYIQIAMILLCIIVSFSVLLYDTWLFIRQFISKKNDNRIIKSQQKQDRSCENMLNAQQISRTNVQQDLNEA